ncbi:MAG: serine hydroxymethyltransferase [Candidatus Nanohaloarchaea archaeon]|nr:serine hydroxymethyltransferase [Candidatus Nanohaloarchaea archaeon]
MENRSLKKTDPKISELLNKELERQESHGLEMIASENFVPRAVLEAQGSILTNKYAEGYPGDRYYAGCKFHDRIEDLARNRAVDLFNADHVNVQPHSGSQANFAAYFSVLDQGDTILGPSLSHGGHLSHGHSVNFSGKLFDFKQYTVDQETERFERDHVVERAVETDPDLILCGYSSYPREIPFSAFQEAAEETDAVLMADIAHVAGLVSSGVHEDPFPECDIVTTTTHKTLRGARGGMIMCKEELADRVDKSVFPFTQGGPLMHQIAAKAVSFRIAQKPRFDSYQRQVVRNAEALAEGLQENGFRLVTGGTDNHLVLVDVSTKDLTGKEAESILEKAGIIVNKNVIPFDERSPKVASGVRIGTPALTTRGMDQKDLGYVADLISRALQGETEAVRSEVEELLEEHSLYRDSDIEY